LSDPGRSESARPSWLPIPAPEAPPPRLTVGELPPYRFVPGRDPHPRRDPQGHACRVPETAASGLAFCWGVDLFNARYFWEAHEAWELVWRRSPRGSAEHWALKGLIQITASLLTLHLGRVAATRRLAARGLTCLERAAADLPRLHGLDLGQVAAQVRGRLVVAGPIDVAAAAFCLTLDDGSRESPRAR
jgi:hypothetical protein